MQRFAVWLFKGWARPALFIVTNVIVFELLWRHVSQGWAACFGMLFLGTFSFLKVLDRLAHVTPEERARRRFATQIRRGRRTAAIKQMIIASAVSEGPVGDTARAVIARWDEAATAKAKDRLRAAIGRLGFDSGQRDLAERGVANMSGEQAEQLANELEATLEALPRVTAALKQALDGARADRHNDKPRS